MEQDHVNALGECHRVVCTLLAEESNPTLLRKLLAVENGIAQVLAIACAPVVAPEPVAPVLAPPPPEAIVAPVPMPVVEEAAAPVVPELAPVGPELVPEPEPEPVTTKPKRRPMGGKLGAAMARVFGVHI